MPSPDCPPGPPRSPYPSRLAGLLRGAAEAAGAGGGAGEIRRLRLLSPAKDSPQGQGQSPRPQQVGTAPRGHHCGPLQCCAGPGTPCPYITPSRTLDPHVTLSLACPCPHPIPSLGGPSPMQSCPHVSCHHTNLAPFRVSLCHPPSCQLASKPPKCHPTAPCYLVPGIYRPCVTQPLGEPVPSMPSLWCLIPTLPRAILVSSPACTTLPRGHPGPLHSFAVPSLQCLCHLNTALSQSPSLCHPILVSPCPRAAPCQYPPVPVSP